MVPVILLPFKINAVICVLLELQVIPAYFSQQFQPVETFQLVEMFHFIATFALEKLVANRANSVQSEDIRGKAKIEGIKKKTSNMFS